MTDSNRALDQQFPDQYHQPSGSTVENTSEHSTADHPITTGVSVVSGGLAGAILGQFVAGRLGAAIGAVVGGVAGAALSQEAGDGLDQAVEEAKAKVQDAVAEIQPTAQNAIETVREKVKDTVAEAKPAAQNAIETVKARVQETKPADADMNQRPAQNVTEIQDGVTAINTITMGSSTTSTPTVSSPQLSIAAPQAETSAVAAPVVEPIPPVPVLSVDEQYERGLELGKQGNLVGAIAAFQSVVEREPDYAEAHYNLGVVLGRHGLREQGIKHIQISHSLCKAQGRDREASNIEQILHRLGAE
jgi:uncharacterized membrane protein